VVILATNQLAAALDHVGQYAEAIALMEGVVATLRQAAGFPESSKMNPEHSEKAMLCITMQNNFAYMLSDMGDPQRALPLLEESLEYCRRALPKQDLFTAQLLHIYASTMCNLGHYAAACLLQEEALAIRLAKTPKHRNVSVMTHNLAGYYAKMGQHGEALDMYRLALERKTEASGVDHPDVGTTLLAIARAQGSLGQRDEALRGTREALAYFRRILPPTDMLIGGAMHQVANCNVARLIGASIVVFTENRTHFKALYEIVGPHQVEIPVLSVHSLLLPPDEFSLLTVFLQLAAALRDIGQLKDAYAEASGSGLWTHATNLPF